MKKIAITIFILALTSVANQAMAGTSININNSPNNGEKGEVKEGKEESKYTFTLFSFFTLDDDTKSDSLNTTTRALKPKAKLSAN